MSLKGFFSIFKGAFEKPDYATLSPIQRGQLGLDVAGHIGVQLIASDAVEAGTTTRVIAATAHVAKRGDLLSFTSGVLQTREVRVQETTTDTITLCEVLESAPAAGVTFDILRDKMMKVGADGSLSATFSSSGLATSAKQDTANTSLASIDTKTPALGQGLKAASSPVVIASDQGALAISAASLPLPTGAATAAAQTTLQTSLSSIDTKTPSLGQGTMAASSPVVIASNQSSIPVAASNLPTTVDTNTGAAGASTLRAVLATRHEAAATPVSMRQSDGTNFYDPPGKGKTFADSVRYTYVTAAVGTVSWVQLIASTAADINALMIFDSSGQTLELGTGAAASESRKLIIPPGGFDGPIPLRIAAGTRVAIRALSATTGTVGEINITGLT